MIKERTFESFNQSPAVLVYVRVNPYIFPCTERSYVIHYEPLGVETKQDSR